MQKYFKYFILILLLSTSVAMSAEDATSTDVTENKKTDVVEKLYCPDISKITLGDEQKMGGVVTEPYHNVEYLVKTKMGPVLKFEGSIAKSTDKMHNSKVAITGGLNSSDRAECSYEYNKGVKNSADEQMHNTYMMKLRAVVPPTLSCRVGQLLGENDCTSAEDCFFFCKAADTAESAD